MIASPYNIKDVDKYFTGTFILVPEVTDKHVMSLVKVSSAGLVCRDSRTNKDGLISFEDGFTYEIKSPLATRKAWFVHAGVPYIISRIPARMWKKGISSENTLVCRLNASGELSKAALSSQLVNSYLQSVYDDELKDNTSFQLLSPQWMLDHNNKVLRYWNFVTGKLSPRTKEIFVPKEYSQLTLPKHFNEWKVKHV